MDSLRSERLDRRIRIERISARVWLSLATVWAEVKFLPGREFAGEAREQAVDETLFRIRWRRVLANDRIVYDGEVYNITSISEIGRGEGLDIRAQAAVI